MRWGVIFILLLILMPVISASSTTGVVSLSVVNPTYEQGDEDKTPIQIAYEKQEEDKKSTIRANLVTGHAIVEDSETVSKGYQQTFLLLGLIAVILVAYLVYVIHKKKRKKKS